MVVECNADADHPCSAGPNEEPCPDCKANEAYFRNLWENGGREEFQRERTYVADVIAAGRGHLLGPNDREEQD